MHCPNPAEHAIQTFKDHFLSILAGVDPSFPPYLWDLLLPQAELTLNLLQQAALNPWISAWEFFNGLFDFTKTPLGPVGCCILVHTKPATRCSWDYHAKEGFYIRPTLDLYRCFKLVNSNTKSKVISDTVEFHHAYQSMPSPSVEDKIIHGLQVMAGALKDAPLPTQISQVDAIANLQDLFEFWHLPGPPSSSPTHSPAPHHPRVDMPELPRVAILEMPRAALTPTPVWMPSCDD
jgi:hypothetical protein